MEIVLNIDAKAAEVWNNSSAQKKAEYETIITTLLTEQQIKIPELNEEQLAIIAEDTKGEPYEWWNDEQMVAELDQIAADMESGKDKGFTLEESRAHLMARFKKNG